jgi:hypothetical protein
MMIIKCENEQSVDFSPDLPVITNDLFQYLTISYLNVLPTFSYPRRLFDL